MNVEERGVIESPIVNERDIVMKDGNAFKMMEKPPEGNVLVAHLKQAEENEEVCLLFTICYLSLKASLVLGWPNMLKSRVSLHLSHYHLNELYSTCIMGVFK